MRQDFAFQYIEREKSEFRGFSTLRVFSLEVESKASSGSRRYLVLPYNKFWNIYRTLKSHRHFYELIREGSVARLYFDVEFEVHLHPNLNGIDALKLFLSLLFQDLTNEFGIDASMANLVDLRSTSPAKFSHHIIVPNAIFVNNVDMGLYVKHFLLQIYQKLKVEHDTQIKENENNEKRGLSRFELLFPVNGDGEPRSIIDTAVYTKNRNFRIWKSSKLGKDATLEVGELDTVFRGDVDDYFPKTLVGHIPYEYRDVVPVSFEEKAIKMYSSSGFGDQKNSSSTAVAGIPPIMKIKVPRAVRDDGAVVTTGDVSFGSGSPFPALENFLFEDLQNWPGHSRPSLRGWRFVEGSGSITYNIGNNKWCERIEREHKSNHIFIVCLLRERMWFQSCHDPECRAVNYEGTRHPIPWHVEVPGYSPFEDLDNSLSVCDFDPDEVARNALDHSMSIDSSTSIIRDTQETMDVDLPVAEWEMDFDPDEAVAAYRRAQPK